MEKYWRTDCRSFQSAKHWNRILLWFQNETKDILNVELCIYKTEIILTFK